MPDKMSDMFKWCKYFYTFDPLIHGAINALSTFPVTNVTFEESVAFTENIQAQFKENPKDGSVLLQESDLLRSAKYLFNERINIYKLLIEIGIDYFLYGNCFVFGEITSNVQSGDKEWKFIRRLPVDSILIDTMPDGSSTYRWRPPATLKRIIQHKSPKEAYEKIPDIVKRAVMANKTVRLKSQKIYHFSKPSDSLMTSSWATPGIANVLKLLMYRNILRQAQEAIAREHIVPLRIFYLNPTNGQNPTVGRGPGQQNIQSPQNALADQISKASSDPNYKIVSNIPIGMVTAGGHGRSLLLTPEIDQIQGEILAGMNVPKEFIFGGVSFSGSSVSLKILENHFITYRLLITDFMNNFIIKGLAKARGLWTTEDDNQYLVRARLADLKMQDDVQQKQSIVNLNASGKVSDAYLLGVFNIDPKRMDQELKKEALGKSRLKRDIMLEDIYTTTEVQKAQIIQQIILQEWQQSVDMYVQQNGLEEIKSITLTQAIEEIESKVDGRNKDIFEIQTQQEQTVKKQNADDMSSMALTIVSSAEQSGEYGAQQLQVVADTLSDVNLQALLYKIKEFILNRAADLDPENPDDGSELMILDNAVDEMFILKSFPTYEDMISKQQQTMNEENAMMQEQMNQEEAPQEKQTQDEASSDENIDMRAYPEQRPPRRNTLG